MDVKDAGKNRFPIYIDYNSFKINGENVLKSNVLVNHDEPFVFTKIVGDGETVDVEIDWMPFNHKSRYVVKDETSNVVKKIRNKFF